MRGINRGPSDRERFPTPIADCRIHGIDPTLGPGDYRVLYVEPGEDTKLTTETGPPTTVYVEWF